MKFCEWQKVNIYVEDSVNVKKSICPPQIFLYQMEDSMSIMSRQHITQEINLSNLKFSVANGRFYEYHESTTYNARNQSVQLKFFCIKWNIL